MAKIVTFDMKIPLIQGMTVSLVCIQRLLHPLTIIDHIPYPQHSGGVYYYKTYKHNGQVDWRHHEEGAAVHSSEHRC